MSELMNTTVSFISAEAKIRDGVELMAKNEISSVLVTNAEDLVVGILTEKDIVRKITLLEVADKLERGVGTIMTRPIHFVHIENLNKEIIQLHLQHRVRHFPVLSAEPPVMQNVIGIVSVTDFLRQFILPTGAKSNQEKLLPKPLLGIMTGSEKLAQGYFPTFTKLGFQTEYIGDFHKAYTKYSETKKFPPILFDLDGFREEQLKQLIPVTRKYRGPLILTTSNPAFSRIYSKHIHSDQQIIALKPLDVTYLHWLLTIKWIT
jgi:CBS domain-containing protein